MCLLLTAHSRGEILLIDKKIMVKMLRTSMMGVRKNWQALTHAHAHAQLQLRFIQLNYYYHYTRLTFTVEVFCDHFVAVLCIPFHALTCFFQLPTNNCLFVALLLIHRHFTISLDLSISLNKHCQYAYVWIAYTTHWTIFNHPTSIHFHLHPRDIWLLFLLSLLRYLPLFLPVLSH